MPTVKRIFSEAAPAIQQVLQLRGKPDASAAVGELNNLVKGMAFDSAEDRARLDYSKYRRKRAEALIQFKQQSAQDPDNLNLINQYYATQDLDHKNFLESLPAFARDKWEVSIQDLNNKDIIESKVSFEQTQKDYSGVRRDIAYKNDMDSLLTNPSSIVDINKRWNTHAYLQDELGGVAKGPDDQPLVDPDSKIVRDLGAAGAIKYTRGKQEEAYNILMKRMYDSGGSLLPQYTTITEASEGLGTLLDIDPDVVAKWGPSVRHKESKSNKRAKENHLIKLEHQGIEQLDRQSFDVQVKDQINAAGNVVLQDGSEVHPDELYNNVLQSQLERQLIPEGATFTSDEDRAEFIIKALTASAKESTKESFRNSLTDKREQDIARLKAAIVDAPTEAAYKAAVEVHSDMEAMVDNDPSKLWSATSQAARLAEDEANYIREQEALGVPTEQATAQAFSLFAARRETEILDYVRLNGRDPRISKIVPDAKIEEIAQQYNTIKFDEEGFAKIILKTDAIQKQYPIMNKLIFARLINKGVDSRIFMLSHLNEASTSLKGQYLKAVETTKDIAIAKNVDTATGNDPSHIQIAISKVMEISGRHHRGKPSLKEGQTVEDDMRSIITTLMRNEIGNRDVKDFRGLKGGGQLTNMARKYHDAIQPNTKYIDFGSAGTIAAPKVLYDSRGEAIALHDVIINNHEEVVAQGLDYLMQRANNTPGFFLNANKPVDEELSPIQTTALLPEEEKKFREWYKGVAKATNQGDDPDHKDHNYDYRALYLESRAGEEFEDYNDPSKLNVGDHFPSKFKTEGHPRLWLPDPDKPGFEFNTKTQKRRKIPPYKNMYANDLVPYSSDGRRGGVTAQALRAAEKRGGKRAPLSPDAGALLFGVIDLDDGDDFATRYKNLRVVQSDDGATLSIYRRVVDSNGSFQREQLVRANGEPWIIPISSIYSKGIQIEERENFALSQDTKEFWREFFGQPSRKSIIDSHARALKTATVNRKKPE